MFILFRTGRVRSNNNTINNIIMNGRDDDYYHERLQNINLEDITSSKQNRDVLSKFYNKNPNFTKLVVDNKEEYNSSDDESSNSNSDDISENEKDIEFKADYEDGDDLGWLGYFIGRSTHLTELSIWEVPYHSAELRHEQVDAFARAMSHNRSIVELVIQYGFTGLGVRNLCTFFGENNNLRSIGLSHFEVDNETARLFASMLGQRQHNTMKFLELQDNDFGDEEIEAIATALSGQSSLEHLSLMDNYVGKLGCIALGTTLEGWQAPNLMKLDLAFNDIDDEGLHGLAAGLVNCTKLTNLDLSWNDSITAIGLRSLAPFFQSEHCCLRDFKMFGVYFGDEGAIVLVDGLVGNTSLEEMSISIDGSASTYNRNAPAITDVGWSAFSRLLCDTSSVSKTYMSNHTLLQIYKDLSSPALPSKVEDYLELNRNKWDDGGTNVPMLKILTHHNDLEMEPFFKWKLKFLPVVVHWFDMAKFSQEVLSEVQEEHDINMVMTVGKTDSELKSMEFSTIYKFVRAMPMLVLNGLRGKKKKKKTSSRKRKSRD